MYLYGHYENTVIALDECTRKLEVERRRIYDIINILESFNVLSRKAKNLYEWRGAIQILYAVRRMREQSSQECSPLSALLGGKTRRKPKSLGILCQSFIKQFMNWKSVITLEEAARNFSGMKLDESKIKTKVRRLYDIANVLSSLKLIEKTHLEVTRKPAFRWVGEEGFMEFIEEMKPWQKDIRTEPIQNIPRPVFPSVNKSSPLNLAAQLTPPPQLRRSNSLELTSQLEKSLKEF